MRKVYNSIEFSVAKDLFGFAEETDQSFAAYLAKRGFTVEGTAFVVVPSSIRGVQDAGKVFHLS